jgi:hypothetical protein
MKQRRLHAEITTVKQATRDIEMEPDAAERMPQLPVVTVISPSETGRVPGSCEYHDRGATPGR